MTIHRGPATLLWGGGVSVSARAVCVVLVPLAACPPPEPEPEPVSVESCPIYLAIGDGESPFQERVPGEEAVIVHGPQGGFHIETSLRGEGLSSPWEVAIEVLYGDPPLVISEAALSLAPSIVPGEPCAAVLPRTLAILDVHEITDDTPAELLDGEPIRIEAHVIDADGRTADAGVDVFGRSLER